METYLGIDGGGSKTRALLVDAKGCKLHYAKSGPSNLNAYGVDIVRTSLLEVIEQCIEVTGAKPTATCFGIAGASSPKAKAKLETLIQPLGLQKVAITSDAAIALEGAFPGAFHLAGNRWSSAFMRPISGPKPPKDGTPTGPAPHLPPDEMPPGAFSEGSGILLIAGTGSVCFGKSAEGEIQRTGGWGWLADDAGSAAWIGQRGLEAALQQNDGRTPGSALRDAIFAELEISSDDELNSKLYQPLLSRSRLGELAECVLGLAKNGDAAARGIQKQAVNELEKLVRATADKLQGKVITVAITGGLLVHNQSFRQELESRLFDFKIQEPHSTPLDGAVAIARRL